MSFPMSSVLAHIRHFTVTQPACPIAFTPLNNPVLIIQRRRVTVARNLISIALRKQEIRIRRSVLTLRSGDGGDESGGLP